MTLQATERQGAAAALERLPSLEADVAKLVHRISPFVALPAGARVLDLGAAQGVTVAALRRAGFDAVGVEPWDEARAASDSVAEQAGLPVEVVAGSASSIPFPDGTFQLVHAQSVMEHVPDLPAALREIARVVRPGGGFWFMTTSALSPRQNEIRGFPLFPWYPAPAKRRIMDWAVRERPGLVGGTTMPAYHWFTPRMARRELRAAGFAHVVDRWELKREDELTGWRLRALRAVRSSKLLKLGGDVVVRDSSYLAIR